MGIKFQLPTLVDVKPRLTVIGIGGAGCNAVNNMIAAGLQGVDFVVANTDAQSLAASSAEHRIQLGAALTEGLGAGSKPEIGEAAAEEAVDEIRGHVVGSHMVFIAAGMGGGTGTGAAAVVARAARELGILTVAIVTKPFQFEGSRRMRMAEAGIQVLRQHVDTLIVIPNQNLFRVANERTTFAEAFVLADQVLYSGVACIVDLVLKEGLINLDFADVRTIMSGMGTAMMGTGEATGDRRAILAAEEAIANPLLDDVSLKGARGLLLSITGGRDLTLFEVDEAASRVRQEVDPEANIIVGATFDDNLGDRVRVSIVASGMSRAGEQMVRGETPAQQSKFTAQHSQQTTAYPGAGPVPASHQRTAGAPSPAMQPIAGAGFIPPSPPLAAAGSDDMQRKLTEVLQQAQGMSARPSVAPMPPQTQVPQQRPAREAWAAPGNVQIEDGLNSFGHHGGGGYHQPSSSGNAPRDGLSQPSQPGFIPAPPAEIRRVQRRMPELEDFPAVGQRDWQAKTSPQQSEPPPMPHKRPGLLGRLTGLGRRSESDPNEVQNLAGNATIDRVDERARIAGQSRDRR